MECLTQFWKAGKYNNGKLGVSKNPPKITLLVKVEQGLQSLLKLGHNVKRRAAAQGHAYQSLTIFTNVFFTGSHGLNLWGTLRNLRYTPWKLKRKKIQLGN